LFAIRQGTTVENIREVMTDLDYVPSVPLQRDVAWGASIHNGFNQGLFGSIAYGSSGTPVQPFGT